MTTGQSRSDGYYRWITWTPDGRVTSLLSELKEETWSQRSIIPFTLDSEIWSSSICFVEDISSFVETIHLLWTEVFFPQVHTQCANPQCDCIWRWGLQGGNWWGWLCHSWLDRISVLKQRGRDQSSLYSVHWWETGHVRTQWEDQPWEQVPAETQLATSLILDVQPSELWERTICWSYPVCGFCDGSTSWLRPCTLIAPSFSRYIHLCFPSFLYNSQIQAYCYNFQGIDVLKFEHHMHFLSLSSELRILLLWSAFDAPVIFGIH